jgi:hypothetical protein
MSRAMLSPRLQKYLEPAMWFCIVVAVALSFIVDSSDVARAVKYSLIVAAILIFFEVFWIAGIVIMGIGYGMSLKKSGALALNLPKLWELVRSSKPNFLVWAGHYTNWLAAALQGLALLVAGLFFMPSYLGGVVVAGLLDLALTFLRCIPMQVILKNADSKLHVTTASAEDVLHYYWAQIASWNGMAAPEEMIASRISVYRDGILVARRPNGEPVGFVTTILLDHYDFDQPRSWEETTGNGWCTTHSPKGRIMFGVDMSKVDDASDKASSDRVYDDLLLSCMARMFKDNLKTAVLGGRLPGYHRYADTMSAKEYLEAKDGFGRPLDFQLRMYLSVPGVKALGVIPDYFPDPESLNYGVLLRWDNPVCSSTNHNWWRIFTSNQLARNVLAWLVPRVAAAEMAYSEWRTLRRRNRQLSR